MRSRNWPVRISRLAEEIENSTEREHSGKVLDCYRSTFQVGTMRDHVERVNGSIAKREDAVARPPALTDDDINPPLVGAGSAPSEE